MNMTYQFNIDKLQSALHMDQSNNEHPLTNPNTNSPDDAAGMFSSISFNKGSSIIKMMRDFIGPETFRCGVSKYLKEMYVRSKMYSCTI